jgi:hypothetical protein
MAKKLTDEANGHNSSNAPIDQELLRKDIQEAMATRENVASSNQKHGAKLKTLGETRGYHMGAFKLLMQLAKKSHENAADFLRTFDAGREALQLGTASQPDLLDEAAFEAADPAKLAPIAAKADSGKKPSRPRRVRNPDEMI